MAEREPSRNGHERRNRDGERERDTPEAYRGGYSGYPAGFGGGVGAYRGLGKRTSYDPGAFDRQLYRHEENAFIHRDAERRGMRGPHYGKGPKGYRRSDERIYEDVCERIAAQGWVDASDVEVQVRDGEVTLTGTVDSRDDKRALERFIDRVWGVSDVHNQLRIPRR